MSEKIKYIEGVTSTGFEYKIDSRRIDNYELLEAVSCLETSPSAMVKVLTLLLGEDKDRLRGHLRDGDGFVPLTKMEKEIEEILLNHQKTKNS
ncbi:MAG: hypothetical protein ACOXZ0_06905 [Eubacteriales bacterium]|jgi:hypothetical protein